MSPTARYLWHQRLAWLLMIYVAAVGATIAPEFAVGRLNVSMCLRVLMVCAIVMACVKDSALRGRPIPYSLRLPMMCMWPIAVPLLECRARRWWGLAWITLHFCVLIVVLIVAQICVAIAGRIL